MKSSFQVMSLWGVATFLLTGCAADTLRESVVNPPGSVAAVPTPVQSEDGSITLKPTDEEVMYRVFAAEYHGSEGDFESAVGDYLEAAMRSEDPEIARRATRVAYATEAWQQAAMAAETCRRPG